MLKPGGSFAFATGSLSAGVGIGGATIGASFAAASLPAGRPIKGWPGASCCWPPAAGCAVAAAGGGDAGAAAGGGDEGAEAGGCCAKAVEAIKAAAEASKRLREQALTI